MSPGVAAARLSNATLPGVRGITPGYDRGRITAGIVHLGVGAFHRAHQAVYVDDLLASDPGWGIVGASLRSTRTAAALNPQDGLYTLQVDEGSRIVGSLLRVVTLEAGSEALLQQLTDPAVRLVSLTVTEKGYCHDPAHGTLALAHPDIAADLAQPRSPRSAPGIIVEALRRRRADGVGPFSVMSCDNLSHNGEVARAVVVGLAGEIDATLAGHIDRNVSFPSTMVDRIVPASTPGDRARVLAATGVVDEWPVVAEPFTQWVIEDAFCAGRPAFEAADVQMVADVAPYEAMKLRMLNASHSAIAYLGYLAGHATVAEAMADNDFEQFVAAMMSEEVIPSLSMPGSVDLAGYRDALLARFRNPRIRHQTWQIAMDGSQKLPQRLLGTIRIRLARGQHFDRLALAVAGWIRFAGGRDEAGGTIDVRDPLQQRFAALSAACADDVPARARAFVDIPEIFGEDLARDATFMRRIGDALSSLYAMGAQRAVARLGNPS
jgi:fructuronate reductase